jgi:DNA polymerase III epsilon subunit-like protein
MITIFDVETTGFPSNNHPFNHPAQARILQLAAGQYDFEMNEIGFYHAFIKIPDDQEVFMSDGAFAVHGITLEYARKFGIDIQQAFMNLQFFCCSSFLQIGHNIAFDLRAINVEEEAFPQMPKLLLSNRLCTMAAMTDVCKLKKSNGAKKAPTLAEAYEFVADKPCFKVDTGDGVFHRAPHDVRSIAAIYRYLLTNGIVQLPSVILESDISGETSTTSQA